MEHTTVTVHDDFAHLFSPQQILPSQILRPTSQRHINERELLAMVLIDAHECATRVITSNNPRIASQEQLDQIEAIDWFLAGDAGAVFFNSLCDVFDLDPDAVRAQMGIGKEVRQ